MERNERSMSSADFVASMKKPKSLFTPGVPACAGSFACLRCLARESDEAHLVVAESTDDSDCKFSGEAELLQLGPGGVLDLLVLLLPTCVSGILISPSACSDS